MSVSRETSRQSRSQPPLRMPEPYTPTPDGFERRLRAWVSLPTDDAVTPPTGDAGASPKGRRARHRTRGATPVQEGQRRRRRKGPNA
jgi:hypothetical protein